MTSLSVCFSLRRGRHSWVVLGFGHPNCLLYHGFHILTLDPDIVSGVGGWSGLCNSRGGRSSFRVLGGCVQVRSKGWGRRDCH
jgi:hypothetical protein